MSIDDHLLEDETILAECEEQGLKFYATNKRLLKYRKSGGFFSKETLHDISYGEITSISLEMTRGSRNAVILGVAVFIIGMMGQRYLYFIPGLGSMTMLLLVMGVIPIIAGLFSKQSWFQLKGPGLLSQTEEKEIWKLRETEKADVRTFIRNVREELIKRA